MASDPLAPPVTDVTPRFCRRCAERGHISPLSDTGACTLCVNARAQRWYSENSTRKNAEATTRDLAKRRFSPETQRHIAEALGTVCTVCGNARAHLHWSLDQRTDLGDPMVKGLLCKSCKQMYNRLVHPSKFVVPAQRAEALKAYMLLSWVDPRTLFDSAAVDRDVVQVGRLSAVERTEALAARFSPPRPARPSSAPPAGP